MNPKTIVLFLAKVFFVISTVAIVLAFFEIVAQFLGFSLVAELYAPGRLVELAAMLLIFVIAVELMQIRDGMGTGDS